MAKMNLSKALSEFKIGEDELHSMTQSDLSQKLVELKRQATSGDLDEDELEDLEMMLSEAYMVLRDSLKAYKTSNRTSRDEDILQESMFPYFITSTVRNEEFVGNTEVAVGKEKPAVTFLGNKEDLGIIINITPDMLGSKTGVSIRAVRDGKVYTSQLRTIAK